MRTELGMPSTRLMMLCDFSIAAFTVKYKTVREHVLIQKVLPFDHSIILVAHVKQEKSCIERY